jgi:hypothetical protein
MNCRKQSRAASRKPRKSHISRAQFTLGESNDQITIALEDELQTDLHPRRSPVDFTIYGCNKTTTIDRQPNFHFRDSWSLPFPTF